MANAELNARDAKLVQWLREAHVKEAELEADLGAHIGLTTKRPYRAGLERHLKETRDHKRRVERRIKALGGAPDGATPLPGPIGEVAGKTVAVVKTQLGAVRAAMSEQAETHLRNAQQELREEHVEIAIYTRIETFATEVGDRETATLARDIRRDEERMAKYLGGQLPILVRDVVRAEIPRDQRAQPSRSRRSRTRSSGGARARTASRTTSGSRPRSGALRSGGRRVRASG